MYTSVKSTRPPSLTISSLIFLNSFKYLPIPSREEDAVARLIAEYILALSDGKQDSDLRVSLIAALTSGLVTRPSLLKRKIGPGQEIVDDEVDDGEIDEDEDEEEEEEEEEDEEDEDEG